MRKTLFLIMFIGSLTCTLFAQNGGTEGSLFARDKQGALGFCPLKSTRVRADISGFFARVTVVQEFENVYSDPIEATYTFPLSQNSAVDNMTMRIGDRVIRGKIMKREEAQKAYDAARTAGQAAALLTQQRPNIFTQSVANIMPGEKVLVEISYVETLKYEDGSYEFVFPMVVGPRYNPASMTSAEAKAVSPPIAPTRGGHDVSIEVNLNAGVPIEEVRSVSHEIDSTPLSAESRKIALRAEKTIPNKDFILRYDVTGKKIEDAVITHRSAKGGFFTMMLQPPDTFAPKDVNPKEIVFVLDTSGSMNGFPIEKAKEAMNLALDGLNPRDTFNLITFAGDTSILFPQPVPATPENLERAREFMRSRRGGGGTEMMKAIRAALEPSESQRHVRIVCFMTDGYVGNEAEIIAEIQKHQNARVFSFGIGNSVNRFLLDKMASEGRGEVEYVSLKDDGSKAARRFHERVRNPLMTDVSVDWKQMGAADVYPKRQPDLFSAKPVFIIGRFSRSGIGNVTLKGKMRGLDYQRDIQVNFPESEPEYDALATVWARNRVDDLLTKYYAANIADKKALEDEITQIGLEFRLVTQFTSFVAVEDSVVNQSGQSVRVEVPVQLADGLSGSNVSQEFSANVATSRTVQGLYSVMPTVAKSGLRDAAGRDRGAAGSSVPENTYTVDGLARRNEATVEVTQNGPETSGVASGALNIILKRVETHYKALKSLRADVKLSVDAPKANVNETREGKLTYMTGGFHRIDWKDPEENLSIVKGVYTRYQPKAGQVFIGKTGDETTQAVILALNIGRSDLKNYQVSYVGQEEITPGVQGWHLQLKSPISNLKEVHLWVDKDGMIVQGKFVSRDDRTVTLLLTAVEKNSQLKPEDFEILYPQETKVIPVAGPVQ